MGMSQQIPTGQRTIAWPAIAKAMAVRGLPLQMRLIDGQLAFPDETPPDNWRELRVASAGRMITIKRTTGSIELVCWGNADDASLALRDAMADVYTQAATEL